uniref:UPAR/Ly6 domain-containing protein n=1 Tax=Leptobrachium leishanense TaxID=445787 RepID=A0A8C5QUT2_9ANUR
MRSVLRFLCVLSVLISTGYSLSCIKCMKMGESNCEGLSVTCSPDEACAASYSVSSSGGVKMFEAYLRDCVSKKDCDVKGSYTVVRNVQSKVASTCCYTDNCTPPRPILPEDNYEPNGLTCRVCFSPNSDWCSSTNTIDCQGDENMCILQSSRVKGPVTSITALRGCTTKSICDYGGRSAVVEGLSINVTMICTATKYF